MVLGDPLRAAVTHCILGSTAAPAAPPFIAELPLLHTSIVRHLAACATLLVFGGTLACYQERAPSHADSARAGTVGSLGLVRDSSARDSASREIDDYRLTSDALQRLAAAKRNVSALYARDPSVDGRMRGTSAPKTLDEMTARINSEPGMKAALQQAGLSARDYMISMVALQGAIKGYQLKTTGKLDTTRIPPTVMANIDFVGTHMSDVMQTIMASGTRKPTP
jgi:hypothetical protein